MPTQPRLTDLIPQLPLKLKAAKVVEGYITGIHSSPFRGFSAEFEQYRTYQHGDDLRYFDWKVWAKNEKKVIRQYSEETNLRCSIVLDCSSSMGFPEEHPSKWEFARVLAASLIHLLIRQRDAAGLIAVSDEVVLHRVPRGVSWYESDLFNQLEKLSQNSKTKLNTGLELAASIHSRRGLVIVISDFMQDMDEWMSGFRLLSSQKNDIIALQILHDRELSLKAVTDVLLEDSETGDRLETNFQQIRQSYSTAVTKWQSDLTTFFRNNGIQFLSAKTSEPFAVVLKEVLQNRAGKR
ncbi:MAG: DUF58 domain-containing protein [Bacteroidetes bacterium]|nr:DUF58 domain-containing protein [Bacteroidota bacterium]